MALKNLVGMTLAELQQVAVEVGMPMFAAKQMADWLYVKQVSSIDQMTNISLKLRERLAENYEVGLSAPQHKVASTDGTVKYLFPVQDGHFVEAVYIPDDDRATLWRLCTFPMMTGPHSAYQVRWAARWAVCSA